MAGLIQSGANLSLAELAASSGSSLVGFIQSGTGAVARTVQAKLREVQRTPQDHNGAADASTDNATALANAVAALPSAGGELRIPAGTYDLGSVVALAAKQVRIVGEGLERSIIQLTGSAAAFSSVNAPYLEIEGVTIKRKSGNANTIANMLDLSGPNQLRIMRCSISGANTADIKLTDGYNIEIENCIGTSQSAGSGTWLQCNGTAPTTVRTKGNEITSYLLGIDYGASFGTLSIQDIFVNCNTGRKYSGGNTHVSIGTWAENASAGAFVNEVNGTSSVNVIEIGTRVSGANTPTLWNFTNGATRAQVMSLNGQSAGFVNYTHNIARCRVTKSAGQAIANVTETSVTWNQESYDTDAMHDNATNNSRITIVTPGTYRITANVNYAAGTPAGTYEVSFLKNGTTYLALASNTAVGGLNGLSQSISVDVVLAATDYVEVKVWNNAGGATVTSGEQTNFSAAWLGT